MNDRPVSEQSPSGQELLRHGILRGLAGSLFVVYCGWQVCWLSHGQLPPALLLAVTGLPAPTTGWTRSMLCLSRRDWWGSLAHNPLAVPITLLLCLSLGWLGWQLVRRRHLRLRPGFGAAWVVVLTMAWLAKLTQLVLAGTS